MSIKSFFEPAPPAEPDEQDPPLKSKLFWFFALMIGGVVAVAGSAYILRGLLFL